MCKASLSVVCAKLIDFFCLFNIAALLVSVCLLNLNTTVQRNKVGQNLRSYSCSFLLLSRLVLLKSNSRLLFKIDQFFMPSQLKLYRNYIKLVNYYQRLSHYRQKQGPSACLTVLEPQMQRPRNFRKENQFHEKLRPKYPQQSFTQCLREEWKTVPIKKTIK